MRILWAIVLAAACDSRASATDPQGGARAEQKSKEYESCGATLHCQDDLRCFDGMCRRTARSTVGDYQAAFGAAAKARGEIDTAIAAYAAALGHYEAEKLQVPPDIDCAYGAALAAGRTIKREHAELAARVLHRCVLAVPPSGAMREQALAQLATLSDMGLDPLLLGANKTADLYLTKGAAPPASDKLAVTVTANPQPSGKSYAKVPEKVTGELKPALIACWTQYNKATKKEELTVTIGLKVAFASNPDYEEEGAFVTKIEPAAAGAGPEDACVRAAVEPAIKALRLSDSMSTKLSITVK